jgi:hypothetical protein
MIIYFNTVKRKRPVKEGGDLVKLNWSSKKILKVLPLYPTDPDIDSDSNPRGNTRGGKGMLIKGDDLFVGTYHSILVFDLDLNFEWKITNNLFANIHEMCFSGENIWVSSTAIDCALKVNRQGQTLKTWWPREEPLLQEKYGLRPMDIDKDDDNRLKYIHEELSTKEHHTHLNAVATFGDRTYVLLKRQGVVVEIEPEVRIALEDGLVRGSHSPVIAGDGRRMILCSSFQRDVLVYDLESGGLIKRIHLLDFPEIARLHQEFPSQPFNQSIFVRGLEIIDSERILVGISPAAILEIDLERGGLLDFYQYSSEIGDAVHGLVHLSTAGKHSSSQNP